MVFDYVSPNIDSGQRALEIYMNVSKESAIASTGGYTQRFPI